MKFLKLIIFIIVINTFSQKSLSYPIQVSFNNKIETIEFWTNNMMISDLKNIIAKKYSINNFQLQYVYVKQLEKCYDYQTVYEKPIDYEKIQLYLGTSPNSNLKDEAEIVPEFCTDIQINVINEDPCCCIIQ